MGSAKSYSAHYLQLDVHLKRQSIARKPSVLKESTIKNGIAEVLAPIKPRVIDSPPSLLSTKESFHLLLSCFPALWFESFSLTC